MPSTLNTQHLLMPDFDYIETPSSLSSSPSQVPLQGRPIHGLNDDSSLVPPDASGVSVISNEPKDADYYLDTAIFKVEGTLYKVAKYHFLKSQDFFPSKFAECKSEHDVICLDDVSKDDFHTFLKLLYPLSIMSTHTFVTEEWVTVLKLSTQWKMLDIRNLAIRQLNVAEIDPIDRIVLAQKYIIPQWLSSNLVQLIRREDSLSMDEAEKLGSELALKICRVRDSSRMLPDVLNDDAWNSAVGVEFQKDLQLPTLSAVERVVRAHEKGVLEFLRESYLDLVERPGALSDDEAMKLGCETTARICRVREQRIARNLSMMSSMNLVDDELQAELSTMTSLSAVQRVVMSRGNVAEWLQMSLVEAAQRRQFSSDEVENLGKETMIKLYRVREAIFSARWGTKPRSVCQTVVSTEFNDEIKAVRDRVRGYSGTEEASAAYDVVKQDYDTDVDLSEQPRTPLDDCGRYQPSHPMTTSPVPISPVLAPSMPSTEPYWGASKPGKKVKNRF